MEHWHNNPDKYEDSIYGRVLRKFQTTSYTLDQVLLSAYIISFDEENYDHHMDRLYAGEKKSKIISEVYDKAYNEWDDDHSLRKPIIYRNFKPHLANRITSILNVVFNKSFTFEVLQKTQSDGSKSYEFTEEEATVLLYLYNFSLSNDYELFLAGDFNEISAEKFLDISMCISILSKPLRSKYSQETIDNLLHMKFSLYPIEVRSGYERLEDILKELGSASLKNASTDADWQECISALDDCYNRIMRVRNRVFDAAKLPDDVIKAIKERFFVQN